MLALLCMYVFSIYFVSFWFCIPCFYMKPCLIRTSIWPKLLFGINRSTIYTGVLLDCLLLLHILINLLQTFFMITDYIYLDCCCFMHCHVWSTCFTQLCVFDITSYIDISRNAKYCCSNCLLIIKYEYVAYVLYVILVNISFITNNNFNVKY